MIRLLSLLALLFAPAWTRADAPPVPPATATNLCPAFTLRDQFDATNEFKFPATQAIVLIVADKKGSEQIEGWTKPLAEKFGGRVAIPGLADVSAVPRPLRGFVQSRFKKAITHPVMLDWEGKISGSFNYVKGQANVYLIAPDGRILHRVSGKADAEKLKDLGTGIEALLPRGDTEKSPGPPRA